MSAAIEHQIVARNTATKSENRIHEDSTARKFGFAGGLVPGVTIYAYMCRPVVERLGVPWFEAGRLSARFVNPVYDGEEISVEATPTRSETELDLKVLDSAGALCATGDCGIRAALPSIDLDDYPAAPLPGVRQAATADAFAATPVLGKVEGTFTSAGGRTYLELIGEAASPFEDLAHPGWVLTWANLALTSNFSLGPWIHVSSEVQNFSSVKDGEPIQVRGRVAQTFERRDHEFVELDLLLVAGDERPAAQIRHVAIYKPRAVG